MRVALKGRIVEVGNIDDSIGRALGTGVMVELDGFRVPLRLPLEVAQAREFGMLLYRDISVTVTLSVEEGK